MSELVSIVNNFFASCFVPFELIDRSGYGYFIYFSIGVMFVASCVFGLVYLLIWLVRRE